MIFSEAASQDIESSTHQRLRQRDDPRRVRADPGPRSATLFSDGAAPARGRLKERTPQRAYESLRLRAESGNRFEAVGPEADLTRVY